MGIKFTEVWSENKLKHMSVEYVLKELEKSNPIFQQDSYYCPDCKKVKLEPVIYTQKRKPYFRTSKNNEHDEECNFAIKKIPTSYIINSYDNYTYITEQEQKSLLNRYSLTHRSTLQLNQNSHSHSDDNITEQNFKRIKTIKSEIPKAKLNKYFRKNILERMNSLSKDSKVLFLIYGEVSIKYSKNINDNYKNYNIYIENNQKDECICSMGLYKETNMDKIDLIDRVIDKRVHVAMIGTIKVNDPFINFNLNKGTSIKIEDL